MNGDTSDETSDEKGENTSSQPQLAREREPSFLNTFVSDFTYPQYGVVRSKWLQVPQLIISFFLMAFILFYEVIYSLRFLRTAPVTVSVNPLFLPTMSNWWKCSTYAGSCNISAPTIEKFCETPQPVEVYDATEGRLVNSDVELQCDPLDMQNNVDVQAERIMVDTRVTSVLQTRATSKSVWTLASEPPEVNSHSLMLGVDQFIAFRGATGPSHIIDKSLIHMQGFIQIFGQRELRRIRCADEGRAGKEGHFLDHCPVPDGAFWSSKVSEVSGSDSPDASYAGSGCFVAFKLIRCRVSELLAAAGVDLEKRINGTTARIMGATLRVSLLLTNADPGDFWSWPIGRKPKYVIRVHAEGGGRNVHACRETYQGGRTDRTRLDHYCLQIEFDFETDWREFSKANVALIFVVVGSVLAYGPQVVATVIVKVYSFMPKLRHVSALFDYHIFSWSSHDHDVRDVDDSETFVELQSKASKHKVLSRLPRATA